MNQDDKVNKKTARTGLFFRISFVLFLFASVILTASILGVNFAEWYSRTVSAVLRWLLSFCTGFFTFSLAEIILLVSPIAFVFVFVYVIRKAVRKKISLSSLLKIFVSVIFVVFFVFVNTFGICYFRKPLDENLGIKQKSPDREQLYLATEFLLSELNKTLDAVDFTRKNGSENPHDWDNLDDLIDEGYDKITDDYNFISSIYAKPKKIILSSVMTYTHVSGVYVPFTGEANINTNYPDYVVAFTMAHEKAHQRGVAGEDEANFVAFLALLASGDEYLKYASLMSMYDYFLDSIYESDKEMYLYFLGKTDTRVITEMISYSEFFDKYRDSAMSEIADAVNDSYLKSMGQDDGVKSYGKVVELFCAYAEKYNGLPY